MPLKNAILIPARGGSKGIFRKNLQFLGNGETLLSNSIKVARDAARRIEGDVYVSSEDSEILDSAVYHAAQIHRRPEELASDEARTIDTVVHFLEQVECENVIVLQCTSPLTMPNHIIEAVSMLREFHSIVSVCDAHGGWQCGGYDWSKVNKGQQGMPQYDLNYRQRRQDMHPKYRENGAFYINTRKRILQHHSLINNKVGLYQMSKYESFEIDSLEDLEHIQWLFHGRIMGNRK